MPATIRTTLSRANPAAAAARPGEGVEQRDHHGHVRAADRQHEEVAQHGRGDQDADVETLRGRVVIYAEHDAAGQDGRQQQPVDDVLPGKLDRAAREDRLQLAEGDVRSPEGDRADHGREQDRDEDPELDARSSAAGVTELRPRDQRRGAAAHAVVQGDHLRHLGHLDPVRGDRTDGGPDQDADQDQDAVPDHVQREGDRDRDQHPCRGDQVAATGRARVRPLLDPEDEQREGDDVAGGDEVAVRRQRQPGGAGITDRPPRGSRSPSRAPSPASASCRRTWRASGR